jgi:rRNA maturation endonuclease Nob1
MTSISKSSRNAKITTGAIRRSNAVSTAQHVTNNQRWQEASIPCSNCTRRISTSSTRCPVCGHGR